MDAGGCNLHTHAAVYDGDFVEVEMGCVVRWNILLDASQLEKTK